MEITRVTCAAYTDFCATAVTCGMPLWPHVVQPVGSSVLTGNYADTVRAD